MPLTARPCPPMAFGFGWFVNDKHQWDYAPVENLSIVALARCIGLIPGFLDQGVLFEKLGLSIRDMPGAAKGWGTPFPRVDPSSRSPPHRPFFRPLRPLLELFYRVSRRPSWEFVTRNPY